LTQKNDNESNASNVNDFNVRHQPRNNNNNNAEWSSNRTPARPNYFST